MIRTHDLDRVGHGRGEVIMSRGEESLLLDYQRILYIYF